MGSCMRCGRCCTSFGVCITPFDILRLKAATGLKPSDFVAAIPEPPKRERGEPSVRICDMPSLIILRWAQGKGRQCFFYSGSGCEAYQSRPMLCRTYPFSMKSGSIESIPNRICPKKWTPNDNCYEKDCADYADEVTRYKKIAKEWNMGPGGGLDDFLVFALAHDELRRLGNAGSP